MAQEMTPENFCYWLHGYFELMGSDLLSPKQVKQVKDHLDLVFNKVTPDRNKEERKIKKEIKKKLKLPEGFEFDMKPEKSLNNRYCSDLGSRKIC